MFLRHRWRRLYFVDWGKRGVGEPLQYNSRNCIWKSIFYACSL